MRKTANLGVRVLAIVILVYLGFLAFPSQADVMESSAEGLTVKVTVDINGSPEDIYRKLIRVGDWWESSHTYSGDAHNLTIEERAGGCWCEKLPGGGGVKHMEVVLLMPGKLIRFSGGLGPLQSMGVAGALEFKLTGSGTGTKLVMTYTVGGHFPGGAKEMAGAIDGVLTNQVMRLKSYAETGDPGKSEKQAPK